MSEPKIISDEDRELIIALIRERRRLLEIRDKTARDLRQLTDIRIAEKLEIKSTTLRNFLKREVYGYEKGC